ncbi:MAG: hypothetical protein O9972_20730 [Burkholderiales bacterium]|nr:hypothetical protein [Burkholderiales bacterium]
MSRLARLAAAVLGIAALSACTNTEERVTGAGVGAVAGAAVGGPVGAAVGGVAGAATGPTVASATGVPQARTTRRTTTTRTR